MDDTSWYERLADIPGLGYETPSGIRQPDFKEELLRPRLHRSEWDGEVHEWLSWPEEEGETSASPAQRWVADLDTRDATPEQVLRRLYEALELPGSASTYHFALLSAYEALVKLSRRNPDLFVEVEKLCLLDIALVERLPNLLRINSEGQGDARELPALRAPAFEHLIRLYEQNGLLEDALAVARRGVAAGQGEHDLERLEEKLARIRAEDA